MDLQPYQQQLAQINAVLDSTPEGPERGELLCLKQNIEELISLSHNEENSETQDTEKEQFQDEYAMFMAEMAQEGAIEHPSTASKSPQGTKNYKEIEGKMFRAPHSHHFGQTVYHNCMVSAVPDEDIPLDEDFEVEVLFLNPTHKEMLPCPYFFNADKDCTFGEKCKFSHGETKLISSLEEYVEPKFENLSIGSTVLAKQKNNLWTRAKIKHISKDKCVVSFENKSNQTEDIVFKNILPLENSNNIENSSDLSENSCSENEDEDTEEQNQEEIINMSLLNTPGSEALGNWEKHTKGIGSRLMQKMGYIVGTGLGKDALGRVDPVTAVILPPGKSLDYCMKLREKHGGDQDLFSAEKKMKRLQKKAEKRSEKMYKNSEPKKDLFNFINMSLNTSKLGEIEEKHDKRKFKEDLKTNTERELNVQSFVIHEDMKKCEKNIETLKIALTRHIKEPDGEPYKKIMQKIGLEQEQIRKMEGKMMSIKNEQQIRSDKKKLTIF